MTSYVTTPLRRWLMAGILAVLAACSGSQTANQPPATAAAHDAGAGDASPGNPDMEEEEEDDFDEGAMDDSPGLAKHRDHAEAPKPELDEHQGQDDTEAVMMDE